jgi:multisubunit Na+/H+ antiporter MnhB subunit
MRAFHSAKPVALLGAASALAFGVAFTPGAALAQGATCGTLLAPNTITQPAQGDTNSEATNMACGVGAVTTTTNATAIGHNAAVEGTASTSVGASALILPGITNSVAVGENGGVLAGRDSTVVGQGTLPV